MGALLVVAAPTLVGCDDEPKEDEGDRGPTSPPSYTVLKPRDATVAVEGEDFELVGSDLSEADGEGTDRVLPDGRLVTRFDGVLDSSTGLTFALYDPVSGEREPLPTPWRDDGPEAYPVSTVLDDDRLMISWNRRESGRSLERFMILDLASGRHEEFDLPTPPLDGRARVTTYPQPGADGRLWFQTGSVTCGDGECFAPRHGMLWSFEPGDERPRREFAAARFAVHGDLLAWTDERYGDTVHVRDLGSGTERDHVIEGDCGVDGLLASDALVVARCDWNYNRQVVMDARARPMADLRLSYESASVGDRWVLISPYAYDTATGRLLRLFRPGPGADRTRPLTDDLAVVPLGELTVTGVFARWGLVRLRSAR